MSLPGNGIFAVKGEISTLMMAMRRGARWSSHSYQDDNIDTLMKSFQNLKEQLNHVDDLRLIEPNVYLAPFLDVIRSEETTGPVTSLALAAINKFLSYGLIDPTHHSVSQTVHNIADAVTHAKFVSTDQSSDGVVLIKILQVLRTLTLSPEGARLTNENLCEVMLSMFRICLESRLNELLRRTAEHYLKDMVLLVFMRLPQLTEDLRTISTKQLKMKHDSIEQTRTKRKLRTQSFRKKSVSENDLKAVAKIDAIVDMQGVISQNTTTTNAETTTATETDAQTVENSNNSEDGTEKEQTVEKVEEIDGDVNDEETTNDSQEYVNQRGIRFTPQLQDEPVLIPYGLACIRELFRFLISLCNPLDKQNTDIMIHLGLTLLTVAFEVGADSIGKYPALLALVKDDLCRHLFSLLSTDRLALFTADLQLSFLLFEALRTHLKFQLEHYLTKLIDIIISDSIKISYEQKEIALDNILQLWRIPGFVTELYLNYDCDMYCTNLYEDLTKLLAKNAFSATTGVYHTHLLSLDALLCVIEAIQLNCNENKMENVGNLRENFDNTTNDTIKDINSIIGKPSRVKLSENVPSKEELLTRKNIKKWLPAGTEHFNHKPKKGIQFLQEHGVIKSDSDPHEIALFLRENPALDKKMIGEFISNRKNLDILDAFVKTFDFTEQRIDEALRSYLETFRLPGEAPTISLVLEHFAEHWHKSNGEPFADVDSAFTLAYAVIMLNVDQHNQNAKKQKQPMSAAAFKKNLKGVNGGGDFDENMLDEIYTTIKNDEIVMPAEHDGIVKENYLWKVLLRKGTSKDGVYLHVNGGKFDYELFQLIYAPIVSALSFVFEKCDDQNVYRRVLVGFECCASICDHYNMTNNLDMLIVTLCKFTTLQQQQQQRQNNVIVQFGCNIKAQLALRTVITLIHQHGDNVRESWKNLCDLILSLYSQSLLSKTFVEVEDFIEPSGRITLQYEEMEQQKQDTGILSSLYSYMVSQENLTKVPTVEEQQLIDLAKKCIQDCNLEQLINDSKFLHEQALLEMVKALVELSRGPDVQKSLGYNYNENVTVFFLELLIKIVIQNRDRVMTIWQKVRDHLYTLVMNASVFDYQFLLERSVIGLLRIAIRLMRNEEMSPIVLQSLRMLLLLKTKTLSRISRQISYGLYELLKTSAQNIHTNTDWTIIFTLLECVGAGAHPPKPILDEQQTDGTKSDGEHQDDEQVHNDRGYTSDSELTKSEKHRPQSPQSPVGTPNTGGWILVGNEGEIQPVVGRTVPPTQYGISLERNLGRHDPSSLIKCCESLAFLVRDVAHITPYNFDICVHCIRTFVEASLHGCNRIRFNLNKRKLNKQHELYRNKRSPASSGQEEDDDSDDDDLPSGYHQISIQLLDLMHTLHTRTQQIFKWWAEEGGEIAQETSLWTQGWCPLLQGIARLCCDIRRQIRMSAITYLQRALLVHDLQTLTGPEWEQCFHRVLFPLLSYLLTPINPKDPISMEETRMRAATVLSKVFLHHLTPLLSLPTFSNLWFIILDFMDKYMHADKSDLLCEAIPESLKNMLLVMDSAKVFDGPDGKSPLWFATWERINKFLPYLKAELFREMNQHEEAVSDGEIQPKKHSIETATRSSIILQPPSSQQAVSSPLFAHLGQMVSTPIGNSEIMPVVSSTALPIIPNSTTPIMQPTLQPGMPYMPNYFTSPMPQLQNNSAQHTFPVLYNSPTIPLTTTTEVQPVSLYAEYIGNPYNNVNDGKTDNENDDLNKNTDEMVENNNTASTTTTTNFFQSSNYFNIDANVSDSIPVGSEILFGVEQRQTNIKNIPLNTNVETKTTEI